LPEDSKEKPQTASLFKTMSLETVSLEDALRLLQLPRVVGVAPDGEEVVARNGRYGPYIQQGKESRSLETEEQLFTIDLEGALALLAQPRQRRGQRASAAPLRELGTDPAGGKEILLKEGRFGPYVTDGETNASLRKGDDPETVTLDRALELLTERRAKGPAKRSPRRRKAS
jgi:DNA topoisomerase I